MNMNSVPCNLMTVTSAEYKHISAKYCLHLYINRMV